MRTTGWKWAKAEAASTAPAGTRMNVWMVPDGIDHRYFVGQELDEVEDARNTDHPPPRKNVQVAGQLHQMEAVQ